MGLIGVFAGLGMFCVLLWYCAIYALPVFVGFSTAWWALNHGAGAGCLAVGLVAGLAAFSLGRYTVAHQSGLLRWAGLVLFVAPATYVGFQIVTDLGQSLSPLWRVLFALIGATGAGSVAFDRLVSHGAVPTLSNE